MTIEVGTIALHVVNWYYLYDADDKGHHFKPGQSPTELRKTALSYIRWQAHGRQKGESFCLLIDVARNPRRVMDAYAAFGKVVEIAGNWTADFRGFVLNKDGTPATAENIAFHGHFPTKGVEKALELLCDPRVHWLEWVEISPFYGLEQGQAEPPERVVIPEDSGNVGEFPESPGVPGSLQEKENKKENKKEREKEKSPPPSTDHPSTKRFTDWLAKDYGMKAGLDVWTEHINEVFVSGVPCGFAKKQFQFARQKDPDVKPYKFPAVVIRAWGQWLENTERDIARGKASDARPSEQFVRMVKAWGTPEMKRDIEEAQKR